MFVGDEFQGIEAEEWINGKPDFSTGKHLVHLWDPKCLRCHTELEMLAEIARNRGIQLVILHQPEHEFEDREFLEKTIEDKEAEFSAAHKPEKQRWMEKNSPKKLVIEDGEVKHHSSGDHDLKDLENYLGIQTELKVPHNPQEKHLGLKNSDLHPDHRFHGKKEVESRSPTKTDLSISGEWKQTEECLESGENAEISFLTDRNHLYIVADPEESVKTVKVYSGQEMVAKENIMFSGISHLAELGKSDQKQVDIEVEEGLKLYKMDLI